MRFDSDPDGGAVWAAGLFLVGMLVAAGGLLWLVVGRL